MSDSTVSQDAVVIERTYDAPVDLIWQMWTEPDHFKQWYGPRGATVPVAEIDLRVGGRRLVCMEMQMPDRVIKMWFTGEYREVVLNQRLVYTDALADERGNPLPPGSMGMPLDHPTTTVVTVSLEAVNGRTRMTLTHAGIPADSPGAAGWQMAFDKLADYMTSVRSEE